MLYFHRLVVDLPKLLDYQFRESIYCFHCSPYHSIVLEAVAQVQRSNYEQGYYEWTGLSSSITPLMASFLRLSILATLMIHLAKIFLLAC